MSHIPAPGCLICRCFINRNTGGVNDGGFVHLVAETTVWIQHTFITVTVKWRELVMLGVPPHLPLYSAVILGPCAEAGDGWLASSISLSPGCSNAGSHFETEEAWVWDTGCRRALVSLQPINFCFPQSLRFVTKARTGLWSSWLVPNYTKALISLNCFHHVPHLFKMGNTYFSIYILK